MNFFCRRARDHNKTEIVLLILTHLAVIEHCKYETMYVKPKKKRHSLEFEQKDKAPIKNGRFVNHFMSHMMNSKESTLRSK